MRDSEKVDCEKDSLPQRLEEFMEGRDSFGASPSEFASRLSGRGGFEISPLTLLKRLDKNRWELKARGFSFKSRKSNGVREITVFRISGSEGQQGQ